MHSHVRHCRRSRCEWRRGPPPARAAAHQRHRHHQLRSLGSPAGRLLPLRERRLAQDGRDPGRRVELGRIQRAAREKPHGAARAILEEREHGEGASRASESSKVGDLYASYMDSARVEQLGITPLAAGAASDRGAHVEPGSCRRRSRTSRDSASDARWRGRRPGPEGVVGQHRAGHAVGARHAGSRLLPASRTRR